MHYTETTAIQKEIFGMNNGVKGKEERLCSILSIEVDILGSWMENYVNMCFEEISDSILTQIWICSITGMEF